jgi:CelD/BcsL family acetyltransferase involved in cellulose biosynthesis
MSTLQAQIEPSIAPDLRALPHAVDVQMHDSSTQLEQLRPAWNQLLQADSSAAIFLTPEWLLSWWHAYGNGAALRSLTFSSKGELIAFAPMYLEASGGFPSFRTLRFIGARSGDSDALNIITVPGYEAQVARAFVDHLRSRRDWDVCSLETLPEESAMAAAIRGAIEQEDWEVAARHHAHSYIQLPSSWDGYLQTLQPGFRPLLTRYPKRLNSRYQVRITRCEDLPSLESQLERLYALHQMRWTGRGEPGAFADPARRSFYSAMARQFMDRGWLEFWSLALGDEVVATQFCFRYGDTVSLLQEGFDPKYTEEKVGYALRAHVLQTLIKQGVRCYDFLGGDDAYKLKFGATRSTYLDLRFAGPSARGRMALKKEHFVNGLKSRLQQCLPERAVALLRRVRQGAARDRAQENS